MIRVSKADNDRYQQNQTMTFDHGTTLSTVFDSLRSRLNLTAGMVATVNEVSQSFSYITQDNDRVVFRLSTKDNG